MRMRYLPPRNASLYASIIIHVSIMKYIQSKNQFMEIWKKKYIYKILSIKNHDCFNDFYSNLNNNINNSVIIMYCSFDTLLFF